MVWAFRRIACSHTVYAKVFTKVDNIPSDVYSGHLLNIHITPPLHALDVYQNDLHSSFLCSERFFSSRIQ